MHLSTWTPNTSLDENSWTPTPWFTANFTKQEQYCYPSNLAVDPEYIDAISTHRATEMIITPHHSTIIGQQRTRGKANQLICSFTLPHLLIISRWKEYKHRAQKCQNGEVRSRRRWIVWVNPPTRQSRCLLTSSIRSSKSRTPPTINQPRL